MILATLGIVANSGGTVTYDIDAQAFITATGITDLTIQNAVTKLVIDLKGYGIWSKMKALYPFVGGTASSHKFNLKDPRDLDAAYRLVFAGGWTHSSTGALPNGTTGYADTKFIISNVYTSTVTNLHVSYYSRTNSANITMLGVQDDTVNNGSQIYLLSNGSTDIYAAINTDSTRVTTSATTSQGFYLASRESLSLLKGYKNGSYVGQQTTTQAGYKAQIPIYIGAGNYRSLFNVPDIFYGNKESAFASIGDGLTDTEATAFYNAVQTYQTTLGRQV